MANKSATERALNYIANASRIRFQDLRDNPGARVEGRQVSEAHNQCGHTVGELKTAAKPPFGWIWGNFYRPWQRMFPGEKYFNGEIKEYIPLSLLELQRMIDLGYLQTDQLIDVTTLANTKLLQIHPNLPNINLEVQWASLHAIAAVEKAGGRIRTAYYDLNSLKAAVDPEKWFRSGHPVPARKYPPHSIMNYYTDPNNRGYLADDKSIEQSRKRLAKLLNYNFIEHDEAQQNKWNIETKSPTQLFLGINSGSLVSLADCKVFEPTHPDIIDYYNPKEPLADHLR